MDGSAIGSYGYPKQHRRKYDVDEGVPTGATASRCRRHGPLFVGEHAPFAAFCSFSHRGKQKVGGAGLIGGINVSDILTNHTNDFLAAGTSTEVDLELDLHVPHS